LIGEFVHAFRGRDGKQLWRSVDIAGSTGRVRVADVEGSGSPQVLALSSSAGVVRLNLTNGAVVGFYEFQGGKVFATYTVPGDPRAKMVLAGAGRLFIIDNDQMKVEARDSDVANVSAVEVADIDGDGVPEVLLALTDTFGQEHRLQVRSLNTLAPLWTSKSFSVPINTGWTDQIAVGDVDGDGVPEVVFLSGVALRVFKTNVTASGAVPPRFDSSAVLRADVRVRTACCAAVYLQWDDARPGSAPPLAYRIYRAGVHGEAEALLATTAGNEFVDLYAGGVATARYAVEAVDAAGQTTPRRLTLDVTLGNGARCRRPAGRP